MELTTTEDQPFAPIVTPESERPQEFVPVGRPVALAIPTAQTQPCHTDSMCASANKHGDTLVAKIKARQKRHTVFPFREPQRAQPRAEPGQRHIQCLFKR